MTPEIFLLDVDGVMTTGHFLYDSSGKSHKIFGPHDADGLKMLGLHMQIKFITADVRGLEITRKRIVQDMGYPLEVVGENERLSYLQSHGPEKVVFMGDGYYDAKVLECCAFGIAPANARPEAISAADFVTPSRGGEGAVFDACQEIIKRFFTQNPLQYTVCILAAGKGTRLNYFTAHLNKAFLPVHGKPAISHIIESYPLNVSFVIALGYLGDMLQAFVEAAYPGRSLTFVNVDNYDRWGAGPGYSLLCCKEHLKGPFVLANVDALTKGTIPPPIGNWMGVAPVKDTSRFCSVATDDKFNVTRIDDKKKTANKYAFTGIAGIHDHTEFWGALEADKSLIAGELQVSNGFRELVKMGLRIQELEWYDIGTLETFSQACKMFPRK